MNLRYSDAEGVLGQSGRGNFSADPLLDGGFAPQATSPVIDAGDSTVSVGVPIDLAGNPRAVDDPGQPDTGEFAPPAVVDMGAFEFQGASPPLVVLVPTDAADVAAGMALVRDGGTVILEPQIFPECLDTGGKNLTLMSTDPLDPLVVAATRIVCPNGNAVTVSGGSQLALDGVTVESIANGSGLVVAGGDAQVHRSNLIGRKTSGAGGGALIDVDGTADFFDSEFVNSEAVEGAGLSVFGQATVTGGRIAGNSAANPFNNFPARGAGAYVCCTGSLTMDRVEITGNSITPTPGHEGGNEGGGLLALFDATLTVTNSLIANNTSGRAGAISSFDSDLTIINSTIADNTSTASNDGAVFSFGSNGNLTLRGSILNGNTDTVADANDDLRLTGPGTTEYNNIGSIPAAGTNISANPRFVDRVGGDFRLRGGSPSIDAGTNDPLTMRALALDLDGLNRFHDDTGTFDSGLGTAPIADQGAYEFQGTTIPCLPDLNDDGFVDNGDIGVFIDLFLAGDPAANFNGDGVIDFGDISAFIALFVAGCA